MNATVKGLRVTTDAVRVTVFAVAEIFGLTRRRRPGLPDDASLRCPGPDDDEDWRDIITWYYRSTASERACPAVRRPWWRRRHRGHVIIVGAKDLARTQP